MTIAERISTVRTGAPAAASSHARATSIEKRQVCGRRGSRPPITPVRSSFGAP